MNTIKYLRYKNICPHCYSKLHKNMNNEIYCIKCGLLVLDHYPVTIKGIDNAMRLGEQQWHKRKSKHKKYRRYRYKKKKKQV